MLPTLSLPGLPGRRYPAVWESLYNVPVIVDALLAGDEGIAFNACTHLKVIRMSYGEFERLVRPRVDAIAKPSFVAKAVEVE